MDIQDEIFDLVDNNEGQPFYVDMIKRHESPGGIPQYEVYLDTGGEPTVGWGHTFPKGQKPAAGTIFSEGQVKNFFAEDMRGVEQDYKRLEKAYLSPKYPPNPIRQGVIKNMLFNLGYPNLTGTPRKKGFDKMFRALRCGDYNRAADEMLDSDWARTVKGRAVELSDLMRKGGE